jgi:hypothetical protein
VNASSSTSANSASTSTGEYPSDRAELMILLVPVERQQSVRSIGWLWTRRHRREHTTTRGPHS